ncbi:MAG: trypsin-like peptidase domain-containing protein [Myxococcales bacterium]|nr:trypsin-like peptidase domain-containing protein [Myxococcales bacterium]MCB9753494.1 trypsin-like peptidase domain-containing protein [Myxococcales bacterium]
MPSSLDSSVSYPIWIATGTAVAGVLLGGAAVYLGLQGRLQERAPAPVAAVEPCGCADEERVASPVTPSADTPADNSGDSLVEAIARTRDSVVTLSSGGSIGAGVIVDDTGTVLTNYHVIASATGGPRGIGEQVRTIVARFSNGRELPAVILATDSARDIALLRLQPADSAERFPPARIGRSSELPVGTSVFAVGTPLGFEHSVSRGIISAVDRTHVLSNRQFPLLQLDASINVGNSGGPLFNLDGELIGVTTAKSARGQGIAFAIPIDHVRALIGAFEEGTVHASGQIGVEIDVNQPLSETAREHGFRNGFIIKRVFPGQPAERAGVQVGDVIVAFRGKRYDSFGTGIAANNSFADEFVRSVRALIPGQTLAITVLRGSEVLQLSLAATAATAEQQLVIDGDELLGLRLEKRPGVDQYVVKAVVPGSAIIRWRGIELLEDAQIVRILDRRIQRGSELGAALADIRERVSPGGGGTISITFRLKSGREAVVPDFPLSRG